MRKKVFAKSVSVAALALGLSANSFAADTNAQTPTVEKPTSSLVSLFQEGTLKGQFRSFWGNRYYDDSKRPGRHTLAYGGNLHYETAPLAGFSAGIDFKTTQGAGINSNENPYVPIYAQKDNGNLKNVNALDEYYIKYSGYETTVTAGAQYMFTPAMRGHRIRILDKKYLGLGIVNKSIEKVELYGYYIDQYMGWTEEEFNSITSGWTRNTSDDEGAFVGGVIWRAPGALQLQFWDYYFPDVVNQYYFRGRYKYDLSDELQTTFDLRYFGMKDTGDSLAGDLDTYDAGGIVGLNGYGFSLAGYYATNGDEVVQDPFDAPLVILMQGNIANKAELDAYAIKLGYDFGEIGVQGLSAYVMYGDFNTPDSGVNATSDSQEIDFSVRYSFQGWAKNMAVRARYAIVNNDEDVANGVDFNDFRLYWDFKF